MRRAAVSLLLLLSAADARAARVVGLDGFRMRAGDDAAWAAPALDDSAWRAAGLADVGEIGGVLWLRKRVDLGAVERAEGQALGIFFAGLASCEVWWDGERIARGGVVSPVAAGEKPGPIQERFQIPDRLAGPGAHTLALRLSAHHRGFVPRRGLWSVAVGDYGAIDAALARGAWLALLALSGMAVTGAFAFAMFFLAERDRRFLLLGTLCVSASALLLAESWRSLFGYSYDRHLLRLVLVTLFTGLVAVQLVALVVVRAPGRGGRAVVGAASAAVALCALVPVWDGKALAMLAVALLVSLAWTAAAARRHVRGSLAVLAGVGAVAAGLVADPLRFADSGLFFLLDVLFACLLAAHALDVRRERLDRAEAELKAARLELEVLKRQMAPHFLMNTLTALAEWIEREPRTAVRMIELLADEVRILGDAAGKRLVSAEEELRLCRTHLAVMELRKDVRYELIADGFDGGERVPPGTFHTLVENAVTHGARRPRVALRLRAQNEGERVRFVFESPAEEESGSGTPRAGTGTRYIEARLREAWRDRWTFAQRIEGGVFRAEIVVPAEAGS